MSRNYQLLYTIYQLILVPLATCYKMILFIHSFVLVVCFTKASPNVFVDWTHRLDSQAGLINVGIQITDQHNLL